MLLALACADPVSVTRAVDDRPRILVRDVPTGATLYLDGKPQGAAAGFAGKPGVLLVEPGTHLVEVKLGERLLLSRTVFLGGGEQRTVVVPLGAQ
jgi:hypothetical protein